jgi:hypothetical protein
MEEVIAVVEKGQIKLPSGIRLPDGLKVRVVWDAKDLPANGPYDREMLGEEDVKADIAWATGQRFSS